MMRRKYTLSVIIATHNEEANLGTCLDSVAGLADEILIADGESTDGTVEIAKQYGARVLPMENRKMFHINKQKASEFAQSDWLLFLDADEIITPELSQEIVMILNGETKTLDLAQYPLFSAHMHNIEIRDGVEFSRGMPTVAYFIARKNYFLGRYLMYSGVYPDGVIRLVKRGLGYWPCKDVHETMVVSGGVSWLKEPMIHMADPVFSRYLQRADRYTSLTAQNMLRLRMGTGSLTIINYLFLLPIKTFLLLFIRHKGFMDGMSGFVWALMSSLHQSLAYMKYRERFFK